MSLLLMAIGIFLLLEGLMPALAPNAWKRALLALSELPNNRVRRFGGAMVIAGVVILWRLSSQN
ncbi:DUF2065 domain-containing protein [Echinimonas agarilytica]|uniref:DUF2065 domain-containing protein n=1 Tax=Echinimonas agarilytica TaxID=1215918 RepID=A0AA41W499_9GAMM|nr:DUF2065 domain-containing protein [Echinimonas agarilytica]MCM2678470.1 DUF2065 domain-containing protein [Echinimonas agarilytica]